MEKNEDSIRFDLQFFASPGGDDDFVNEMFGDDDGGAEDGENEGNDGGYDGDPDQEGDASDPDDGAGYDPQGVDPSGEQEVLPPHIDARLREKDSFIGRLQAENNQARMAIAQMQQQQAQMAQVVQAIRSGMMPQGQQSQQPQMPQIDPEQYWENPQAVINQAVQAGIQQAMGQVEQKLTPVQQYIQHQAAQQRAQAEFQAQAQQVTMEAESFRDVPDFPEVYPLMEQILLTPQGAQLLHHRGIPGVYTAAKRLMAQMPAQSQQMQYQAGPTPQQRKMAAQARDASGRFAGGQEGSMDPDEEFLEDYFGGPRKAQSRRSRGRR